MGPWETSWGTKGGPGVSRCCQERDTAPQTCFGSQLLLAERRCLEDGADLGGPTRTWEENSWKTNSKINILKPKIVNTQILQFLIIVVFYYYLGSWVFLHQLGLFGRNAILWWVRLCIIPVVHSVTSSWQLATGQGRCIYTMGISKCCETALGLLFHGLPGLNKVLGGNVNN